MRRSEVIERLNGGVSAAAIAMMRKRTHDEGVKVRPVGISLELYLKAGFLGRFCAVILAGVSNYEERRSKGYD